MNDERQGKPQNDDRGAKLAAEIERNIAAMHLRPGQVVPRDKAAALVRQIIAGLVKSVTRP